MLLLYCNLAVCRTPSSPAGVSYSTRCWCISPTAIPSITSLATWLISTATSVAATARPSFPSIRGWSSNGWDHGPANQDKPDLSGSTQGHHRAIDPTQLCVSCRLRKHKLISSPAVARTIYQIWSAPNFFHQVMYPKNHLT